MMTVSLEWTVVAVTAERQLDEAQKLPGAQVVDPVSWQAALADQLDHRKT